MDEDGEAEVNFRDFYELQKTIYDKLEQIDAEQESRFATFERKIDKMMTEDRAECAARANWMKSTDSRLSSVEIKVGWLIAGVAIIATSVIGAAAIVAIEAIFG